jgi:hypothetical protein
VQSLPSHPLLACRRGRVGITTEYRGGVGGRSRRGGTPVFRRDRRCRVPTPLSGGPHPRRTPSKRRPVTCVLRNAGALFPGWRGLVARLSWARLGRPRSPALGLRAGVSGAVASFASSPCVPAWPGGDHHRITGWRWRPFPARRHAVSRRDRHRGCLRHYPVVPIHNPQHPPTETVAAAFRGTHPAPRKCQTPLPS